MELIDIWAGSLTPMQYAITLLGVKEEKERNERYNDFQNWAFSKPPLLVPLPEVIELWKHQDACPITGDMRIVESIKNMVEHYNAEVPYDQWRERQEDARQESSEPDKRCEGENCEGNPQPSQPEKS